jgi:hypothetical protein
MMDNFFIKPLTQQDGNLADLKLKRKTEMMNHYFDTALATQHNHYLSLYR